MKWWHERLFMRRCLTLQEYVRVDVVTDDMLHAQVEGWREGSRDWRRSAPT